MIVLDASVVVEMLLGRPRGAVAWSRIAADGDEPAAPALLDATCCVALAEGLGAELVTCDARLARAPGLRARVVVIAAP